MKALIFGILLVISTLLSPATAQISMAFDRYTTAWAMESLPNSKIPVSLSASKSKLNLLILGEHSFIKKPNGNRYIKMYLVNSLPYTVAVKRHDATVSGVTTEIYVNGRWKIFQTHMAPSCGQGKWDMNLKSNHYLGIELEDTMEGTIDTPYRVHLKTLEHDVFSNTISVKLRQYQIEMAGKIPPLTDNDF